MQCSQSFDPISSPSRSSPKELYIVVFSVSVISDTSSVLESSNVLIIDRERETSAMSYAGPTRISGISVSAMSLLR